MARAERLPPDALALQLSILFTANLHFAAAIFSLFVLGFISPPLRLGFISPFTSQTEYKYPLRFKIHLAFVPAKISPSGCSGKVCTTPFLGRASFAQGFRKKSPPHFGVLRTFFSEVVFFPENLARASVRASGLLNKSQ